MFLGKPHSQDGVSQTSPLADTARPLPAPQGLFGDPLGDTSKGWGTQPRSYRDAPAGMGTPKTKKGEEKKKSPHWGHSPAPEPAAPMAKGGPPPGAGVYGGTGRRSWVPLCVYGVGEPGAQLGLVPQTGLGSGLPFAGCFSLGFPHFGPRGGTGGPQTHWGRALGCSARGDPPQKQDFSPYFPPPKDQTHWDNAPRGGLCGAKGGGDTQDNTGDPPVVSGHGRGDPKRGGPKAPPRASTSRWGTTGTAAINPAP